MKALKIFLRILLYLFLFVLLVLIITPLLFKKPLLQKAKEVANTAVEAKIDFADLRLSFFKDFPRLTTTLTEVSVVGVEAFEGDTLVAFDQFSATVNAASLIRKEAIKVRGILLDRPRIHGLVLEDGTANWDIAPESQPGAEDADTSSDESMDLRVALKKFEIRQASLFYDDRQGNIKASLEGFDFLLSGDLALDRSELALSSQTRRLNLLMGGIRYVKDAMLDIAINVDADLVNQVYALEDNSFAINDLLLNLEGVVRMPPEGDLSVDLKFSTMDNQFKSLLSMVPAVYMKDFEQVETDGLLNLSGAVFGAFSEEVTPSAEISLLVENARFAYPDLPESAENIGIDIEVQYDGVQNDNTVLDVNSFHVELGGNPVDFTMHLITPVSDPQVNANLTAAVDFSTLHDVIPMEDVNLTGMLDANLDLMGRLSSIENERYEDFKADGQLHLRQFELSSPDIPQPVFIHSTLMEFSPQYVNLAEFDANIGRSDVQLEGRLENFLPFVFEDGTVRGSLDLNSRLLDLNEFMSAEQQESEEEQDSTVMAVVEIPANVEFIFQSRLNKVIFDQLDIDNLDGRIIVKDQRLIMENLDFEVLQGEIGLSGEYNTQDIRSPMVDLKLDVREIDIPSAYHAFVTVQQLAPIAERVSGTVSTKLDFTAFLDSTMSPVMNSIVGSGNLASRKIEINNSKTFEKIGGILKSDRFKVITMENLDLIYSIRNGRVYIQPYTTRVGGSTLVMSGDQGLDQTMNYQMKMKIPRTELGGSAQSVINDLTARAASQGFQLDPGETLDVSFLVTGTFDEPRIRPTFEERVGKQVTEQVREVVQEKVEEKVEETRQQVRDEVNREAERILAEAGKKADALKREAKNAGDELISAAEAEGQKRIQEAGSNPLKKIAAEQYARTLKSEAEKKAARLEEEASRKAEQIMEEAQAQADRLK